MRSPRGARRGRGGGGAESKTGYALSRGAAINVCSVTSASLVQSMRRGWLPLTFLRAFSLVSALRRCCAALDWDELFEKLVITITDFAAFVFTFASLVLVLEMLGNPDGDQDRWRMLLCSSYSTSRDTRVPA